MGENRVVTAEGRWQTPAFGSLPREDGGSASTWLSRGNEQSAPPDRVFRELTGA
jgi:hypothetical protein